MTHLATTFANVVSRLLEPDERDAVLGDLAELNITSVRALGDLLGLVFRRQILAWADWRPWLALGGLVIPLGLALSLVSRYWSHSSAVYIWLYAGNWTWGYLDSPGARRDLLQIVANIGLGYIALVVWSATIGMALANLSRRVVWVNATMFSILLFAGTLGSTTTAFANHHNAAIFSLTFYRVLYPAIVRVVLVLVPALWGIWNGSRRATLSPSLAIVCALAVVLTGLTAPSLESAAIFGWLPESADSRLAGGLWPWRESWLLWLWPAAMAWPAGYTVVVASRRPRRAHITST